MRILHLNTLYPPVVLGGAERFAAALAEEQAKRGHRVGVVTLGRHAEPVQEHNGVLVHRISHSNLFWLEDWPKYSAPVRYASKFLVSWNPIMRRRVRRIIEAFNPDVIHSHSMIGFAVDCWREAAMHEVPVVHTLHDFSLFCRNANAFRHGHVCDRICLGCRVTEPKRWYSRYVSAVVGISHDVLRRHLHLGFFNHIPAERRTVIYNMPPIAVRCHPPRPSEAPFTIGFIGRIVPDKGLEILLDAIGKLPPGGWRLLIAGNAFPPLDLENLKARVAGLPVDWLGFVPAEDFYRRIDLLVVPSLWAEPSGLVILEAFANSVPAVGASIGGIPDLIEQGVTGWLFAPGDVAALCAILTERIRAGRDALPQEAAFARIRSETAPEYVVQRYQQVYEAVVEDLSATKSAFR